MTYFQELKISIALDYKWLAVLLAAALCLILIMFLGLNGLSRGGVI